MLFRSVKLNRKHEAIAPYKEVLRIDPNHPVKHIIAAFSGDTTSTAPAGYIANLFDGYAEKFDSHLVKDLHYNTPSVLLSTIQSHVNLSARQLDVLDLGCGTGLFGKVISPFVGQMVAWIYLQKCSKKQQYSIFTIVWSAKTCWK